MTDFLIISQSKVFPFLQACISDLPPSNQQPIDKTKFSTLFFFLIICFNWMYVTIWKKRSVTTYVLLQLELFRHMIKRVFQYLLL